ncbi:unnamed protein product [Calicophoron daubneyi]|uniref:Phospholipid scramblase n=1 Tax=Calicophoron daubneyi TaxID=300641 RepID=A0AAV2SWW3_CALDB
MSCPAGLEYLAKVDQILVKQKIEILEVLTTLEVTTRYQCLNTVGQGVYNCIEETTQFDRCCFGPRRPFTIHFLNNSSKEVITATRKRKRAWFPLFCSCSGCCLDELSVEAPAGMPVGSVRQMYSGCKSQYSVLDESNREILRIHGPDNSTCVFADEDTDFKIMSTDGTSEIGRISQQWTYLLQEYFTDGANIGIFFPVDLDVKIKAVLLGAVFLIVSSADLFVSYS